LKIAICWTELGDRLSTEVATILHRSLVVSTRLREMAEVDRRNGGAPDLVMGRRMFHRGSGSRRIDTLLLTKSYLFTGAPVLPPSALLRSP